MIEKLKEFRIVIAFIVLIVTGAFGGYNLFAKQADLEAFKAVYQFDKEVARRKELRETVFECKKLYGSDYSGAPDDFTAQFCRDAEIELEETKGG